MESIAKTRPSLIRRQAVQGSGRRPRLHSAASRPTRSWNSAVVPEMGCSENPPGVWRGLPTVAHRLRPPALACFERGSLAMFEVAGSLWYRVYLAPRSWDSAIGYRCPLGPAASSRTVGHRRFPARLKAAWTSWPVESSGSAVDATRRAGYQWPEKLGPRLVEISGENGSSGSQQCPQNTWCS